ncbi:MAG: hypothetical protein LQ338_003257, partial [Usnochroma carphineum]
MSFPSQISAEAFAIITGSFLAGAMADISLLVLPVLLDTNAQPLPLATQWVRVYHYGHRIYPALAITTCLLYSYAAYAKHATNTSGWRVFTTAAAMTIGMLPFTWVFMTTTNNALFRVQRQGEKSGKLGEVEALVRRWRGLHFVRCLFPLGGAVLGLLGFMGL